MANIPRQLIAAHQQGRLAEAERGYLTLLNHNPRDPELLHLLGMLRAQRGENAVALDILTQAIGIRPTYAPAHATLGDVWAQSGDATRAERHYRHAIKLQPNFTEAQLALATLLRRTDRAGEATKVLRTVVKRDPAVAEAHQELCLALRAAGAWEAWSRAAQESAARLPKVATLHTQLAEAHLFAGDLRAGWQSYVHAAELVRRHNVALPTWRGEDLSDAGLFVWTHGGLGEEALFGALLPDTIARAKRCLVQCTPRMAALYRRSFPKAHVIDRAPTAGELEGIRFQSALVGLAETLHPTLATFPPASPWLAADAELIQRLRGRYRGDGARRLLVGMAWQSPGVADAREKTVGLNAWGALFAVPGVSFVSLQHGDCAAALDAVRKEFKIAVTEDREIDPLGDIDRLAAQIAALDIVVTSSNTVAHLAGALGVRTICLLPPGGAPGDRPYWLARNGISPWYRSVEIIRRGDQPTWLAALRTAALRVLDAAVAIGATGDASLYLRSLGKSLERTQDTAAAQEVYARLGKEPGAEGLCGQALAAQCRGDKTETLRLLDAAIATDPHHWQAHHDRGQLLANLERHGEAVAAHRAALEIDPQSGEIHNSLGAALRALGRSAEALEHHDIALRALPGTDAIELNAVAALDDLDRTDEALRRVDQLLSRSPENADAHYSKGFILLAAGRLKEGWPETAWRLKKPTAIPRYESLPIPRWNGEDISGKRILVWTDLGLGDELLTASMIPDVLRLATHVVILCAARLVPLFQRAFPTAAVYSRQGPLSTGVIDGSRDYQMAQAELGRFARPSLDHFPSRGDFLKVDESRRKALREKYCAAAHGARLVGISWRSNNPEIGAAKSATLRAWAPILRSPGMRFISLQYGDCAAEIADVSQRLGAEIVVDPTIDSARDLDDFAAQVAAMDLVVSVSNTTVHFAGALGVPVWTIVPATRGRLWYWFRDRQNSPWYPSMRLFRQSGVGEWGPVLDTIAQELKAEAPE